jgi:hypothetical protein
VDGPTRWPVRRSPRERAGRSPCWRTSGTPRTSRIETAPIAVESAYTASAFTICNSTPPPSVLSTSESWNAIAIELLARTRSGGATSRPVSAERAGSIVANAPPTRNAEA